MLKRWWSAWRGAGRASVQTLRFGPCAISLPPGHLLPTYLRLHPRYDRFLPHLARFLPAATTVVDVGANCGDTLAAMAVENPQLAYLCIEPDPLFHDYLLRNLAGLRATFPALQVQTVQALVGKTIVDVALEGEGGSRHAKPGAGGLAAATLDALLVPLTLPPVSLLKSDVDGFDHDVLASAPLLLAGQRPLLFFECQTADDAQRRGFQDLLPWLEETGYVRWVVFDNFGEVMLARARPAEILQLMDYVWQQNLQRSTRTVYYLDILAGGADAVDRIDAALAAYR